MTKRIYETDAYCREFQAVVLSCEKADENYHIILDQTAFFPEGGGQSADIGTIDGVEVFDVQIIDGRIIHKAKAEVQVGKSVVGKIDWALRFSRMQSHAGEHLVSGIIHSMFGYSNVGFHMSESLVTFDFDGPISQSAMEEIEEKANRAIYENVDITAFCPDASELGSINYRSKLDLDEGVRLVTIDGYDCCACCAPHPSKTGDIGVIKIINFYPLRGGTRIEMLAGINAFKDYRSLHNSNKAMMGLLSASRDSVGEVVQREHDALSELKAENKKLSQKLAFYGLEIAEIGNSVCAFSQNSTYDDLIYCANTLNERQIDYCFLFSQTDGDNYIYVVSSKSGDVRNLVSQLNRELSGKGGGKPSHAQGKVVAQSKEQIVDFIKTLL